MQGAIQNRAVEIAGFLSQYGWESAHHAAFEADFSSRRYARLIHDDGRRAILMDADLDQKTSMFVQVARILTELEIAAPVIYATNPACGLVIMEDLGDRNVGKLLDQGVAPLVYFERAINVLVHLHRNITPLTLHDFDGPTFDEELLTSQTELFLDTYVPVFQDRQVSDDERQDFKAEWRKLLGGIRRFPRSLMLRDYMPDNLMDVSPRACVGALGVLDFQDAGVGPVLYDLISLCEIVRRDTAAHFFDELIENYYKKTQQQSDLEEFRQACFVLSAQRHLRILGVLARLVQQGRTEKENYLPRVVRWLDHLADHSIMKPVERWTKLNHRK